MVGCKSFRKKNLLDIIQILSGNRYGFRPIPTEMSMEEFNVLLKNCDNKNLLNTWYKKDDNNEPPLYILQVIIILCTYNTLVLKKLVGVWGGLGNLRFSALSVKIFENCGKITTEQVNTFAAEIKCL